MEIFSFPCSSICACVCIPHLSTEATQRRVRWTCEPRLRLRYACKQALRQCDWLAACYLIVVGYNSMEYRYILPNDPLAIKRPMKAKAVIAPFWSKNRGRSMFQLARNIWERHLIKDRAIILTYHLRRSKRLLIPDTKIYLSQQPRPSSK